MYVHALYDIVSSQSVYRSSRISTLVLPLPPYSTPRVGTMAITKEPGQKGVNFSNIAVGEYARVAAVHACLT